jgi:hypothetical protein
MFGGMARRRLSAEFCRRAGRIRHSRESRRCWLNGCLHSWPRAFYRHRRRSNLFGREFSDRHFTSQHRPARCDCRNHNVAAHGVLSVLRDDHLADLRTQMGSVDRTPATNPLRQEFDKLHQWSVWIESAVLLLGIAAIYLTVRAK